MRSKNFSVTFILLLVLLFCNSTTKAESRVSFSDTTCCTPDSLTVVSTNYPVFCVSWHIPNDSSCKKFAGFVIQWKLLLSNNWDSEFVPYNSGSYISFCDSVHICGVYQWRVRTKCSDSTYSEWKNGNKFGFDCDSIHRAINPNLSISPNPALDNITISIKGMKQGKYKLSIINMNGRNVFDKTVYAQSNQLSERVSVGNWQRGIYFVTILVDGAVISRQSFLKE